MFSYTWEIQNLLYAIGPDSHGHTSVVYSIEWRLVLADEEDPPNKADWHGTTKLEWSEGDDWIEFEDLTMADVTGWIEGAVGEDELARIEGDLASTLEQDANPTEASVSSDELPWVEVEEEE